MSWELKFEGFFSMLLRASSLPTIKSNSLLLNNMAKTKSPWSKIENTEGFTALSRICL